jgi:acyl-coenzyme A thioesterase PaaI-like protein
MKVGAGGAEDRPVTQPFDFAGNGWTPHDDRGFLGLVGPVWERAGPNGPELSFQASEKHENLRGVVQGGMLMTVVDRMLGAIGRYHNDNRPQATVHLDVHFLAPVRIGDVVVGRGRIRRNTRSLMFIGGVLLVEETPVTEASGVWKKLGA